MKIKTTMSSAVFNTKDNNAPLRYYTPTALGSAVKMLKYQHIAPAPPRTGAVAPGEIKTRKYTPRAPSTGGGPYSVDQTQSVQRRNARERNRVKQVNNSFARLRQHIPQTIIMDLLKGGGRGPHKKISKVDTLRIAVEYIRRLQDLVDDLNGCSGSSSAKQSSIVSRCNSDLSTMSDSSFSSSSSNSSCRSEADSPAPQLTPSNVGAVEQLYYTNNNGALQAFQQLQPQQQQQFNSTLLNAEALHTFTPAQPNPQPQMETPTQTQSQTQPQTQLHVSCPSPTSSFNSSLSFDSGTFEQQQQSPVPHANNIAAAHGNTQLQANLQLKFEPYDSFNLHEEDCTPDDEEILDYISLWQEQ